MKWIFEHFQVFVLIGVALVSWAKHRMDAAQAKADERQAREEMADHDEVPVPTPNRQLVQPSVPPPIARQASPPAARKTTPPPLHTGQAAPVGLSDDALILKQQQDIQERLRQIRDATRATTSGGAAATRSRVSAAQRHPKAAATIKSSLHASLHSRMAIRRAIVMNEILGTPVGLR
jgi:hypothetical protein